MKNHVAKVVADLLTHVEAGLRPNHPEVVVEVQAVSRLQTMLKVKPNSRTPAQYFVVQVKEQM